MAQDNYKYLAHLMGPHAENENLLLDLMQRVLRDYSHWRRNYFPDDASIMSQAVLRQLQDESDNLVHAVNQMMAGLRRSFPFHSPRYIAHQQSETTLASVLGNFAGSLYNSNNVTPESGAVTVDWEIDACNSIMKMIGFRCPPDPPDEGGKSSYDAKLRQEFGWAHITSGGTIANIEALWVAREVAYFPLAVWDACIREDIPLVVKLPGEQMLDKAMSDISDPYVLTRLKPNESIYMLSKFISAVMAKRGLQVGEASSVALNILSDSKYLLANGTSFPFSKFKPVVLVSGAAHYSIKKAADLLGIGINGVRPVLMDSCFRMDVTALHEQLLHVRSKREVPVAVVVIAGSTEEGAVDPIDKILSLRARLESEHNTSFWIHTDAAWGGFIRALFVENADGKSIRSTREAAIVRVRRIGQLIGRKLSKDGVEEWIDVVFRDSFEEKEEIDSLAAGLGGEGKHAKRDGYADRHLNLLRDSAKSKQYFRDGRFGAMFSILRKIIIQSSFGSEVKESEWAVTNGDALEVLREDVSAKAILEVGTERQCINLKWPTNEVGSAFLAMEKSDSISIDPHKMGYGIYPCGVIAFRNDRVRHLIQHDAPYITSNRGEGGGALVHLPPRRVKGGSVATMAFAPFTLEGSRPSSAACGLWLSSKALPFDRLNHGRMVRASLLAARELYEWIVHWNALAERHHDISYRLLSYSPQPPDTNIVIFCAAPKDGNSIARFNSLNNHIYSKFSIKAELGERQHSYSQSFFLSNTEFREPIYPFATMKPFLDRIDARNAEADYKRRGLVVLRATVMNPYIHVDTGEDAVNLLRYIILEIDRAVKDWHHSGKAISSTE